MRLQRLYLRTVSLSLASGAGTINPYAQHVRAPRSGKRKPSTKAKEGMINILNRLLSAELMVINQNFVHAKMCELGPKAMNRGYLESLRHLLATSRLGKNAQDILFTNQHQLFFVALHFSGGVFVVQDMLAGLEGGLHKYLLLDLFLRTTVLNKMTWPHGENLSFPRFLLRGLRNDNAAGTLLAWLAASDQDPIVQRL